MKDLLVFAADADAEAFLRAVLSKLDSFTWSGNSAVTILVPELEQWLWYCESALAPNWSITRDDMALAVDAYAAQNGITSQDAKRDQPKELFEHIARKRLKRTISPYDFEKIGEKASIRALIHCPSFRAIGAVLQEWFPLPEHGAALGDE